MQRRILAVLLAVMMLLGVCTMSGCRRSGGDSKEKLDVDRGKEAIESFDFSEEVTITFTHTMGAKLQDVLNSYIEEFNKIYPNIKIEH